MKDFLEAAAALVAVIAAVIAWLKAAASIKDVNAAKIAAAEANGRADDAVKAAQASAAEAKRAADALHGLHGVEERKLALEEQQRSLEEAQAEGERILLDWVNRAWRQGWVQDELTKHVSQSHKYQHPRIENLAELCAARKAFKHEAVGAVSTPAPKIGEPFEIHVRNPRAA